MASVVESTQYVPPQMCVTIRYEFGPVVASAAAGGRTITTTSDGDTIDTREVTDDQGTYTFCVDLDNGSHTIVVGDEDGLSEAVEVVVGDPPPGA